MIIGFHKTFDKQFKLLSHTQKERAKKSLLLFQREPLHPSLRNHPLKGAWHLYRSISVGSDLRLHYRQIDDSEVLFVAVGTHSQLYK